MSRILSIELPDDLHSDLSIAAGRAGLTPSAFLLEQISWAFGSRASRRRAERALKSGASQTSTATAKNETAINE